MIKYLRKALSEPKILKISVNDIDLLKEHRKILVTKPLLKSAFVSFYSEMVFLADKFFLKTGKEIELGSGAGFFKHYRSKVITSDIRKDKKIDIELNAEKMHLSNCSIRCFYAINVFHHIPNPKNFFSELVRVLKPGGGCILIEPHNGFFSALVHRNLHSDEYFDPNAKKWANQNINGPMSGANQALSYIVFERDLSAFKKEYGDKLEIVYKGFTSNALRYLLSGGLNYRQLVPSFLEPVLYFIEKLMSPIIRFWSLHQIIVIRRK
ncbi:class I SAM-dependent methyltransferase [Candidatus Methylopumilus universalis]|uniref:class I SAM-dependent methyltransferase n=1 Tax=Candidatus Methylopumilus universalis TaxID=2588536 RepID=UPI0011200D71|nr:methyltransferase domain-containing protein [Candidatus Methylopumilus universalis]QDC96503.1 class I SAM-dependent methyltransferase [Candidatus Methylopumilus universalis]